MIFYGLVLGISETALMDIAKYFDYLLALKNINIVKEKSYFA